MYWLLAVDEATKFKMSEFLETKDELQEYLLKILTKIQCSGYKTKYLRCDNGGEN